MKQIEDLPIVLKPKHVAEILGIANSTAYEYMRMSDFPAIEVNGTIRVMRDRFFEWLSNMERNTSKGA